MEEKTYVTSVFKEKEPTKEEYTRIWIELISTAERRKNIGFTPDP